MAITVTEALNAGNDVLIVRGHADDGALVEARGWVSHTTNYFPPSAYKGDGSRDGTPARVMNPAEQLAYFQSLLAVAQPAAATTPIAHPALAANAKTMADAKAAALAAYTFQPATLSDDGKSVTGTVTHQGKAYAVTIPSDKASLAANAQAAWATADAAATATAAKVAALSL